MVELLLEIYYNNPEYVVHEREQTPFTLKLSLPGVDPSLKSGLKPFQLYGGDGNPILHSVWSLVIEPGELITMRFHDEKLNGVGAHSITLVERSMEWVRSWWGRSQAKKIDRDPKTRARLARSPDAILAWLEDGSGSSRASSDPSSWEV
jgi:hypothetical protein